jgi:hypothetical protein
MKSPRSTRRASGADHAHLAVHHPLPDIPVTAGLGGRPPAAPRKPHPTDRSGRGQGRRRSSKPPRLARHRPPAAPRSRSASQSPARHAPRHRSTAPTMHPRRYRRAHHCGSLRTEHNGEDVRVRNNLGDVCRTIKNVRTVEQGPEDPADGGCADPVAGFQQLAVDPLVSPAVVLGGLGRRCGAGARAVRRSWGLVAGRAGPVGRGAGRGCGRAAARTPMIMMPCR